MEDGERKIMIASLRYLDTFAKIDGRWYFAERKLSSIGARRGRRARGRDSRRQNASASAPTAV
jgi:hypothetical protein